VNLLRNDLEVDRVDQSERDVGAQRQLQVVERADVAAFGESDEDFAAGQPLQWKRLVANREMLGQKRRDLGVDDHVGEVDERQPGLFGQSAHQLRARDPAAADDDVAESRPGVTLLVECGGEMPLLEESALQQEGPQRAPRQPSQSSGRRPVDDEMEA
jgi:hypothetical protein